MVPNSKHRIFITKKKIAVISIIGLCALFLVYQKRVLGSAVEGWTKEIGAYKNSTEFDLALKNQFNDPSISTNEKFDHVFKYFLRANLAYQSNGGALVYYPGEVSNKGRFINSIEGFARFFPFAASWMYSNKSEQIILDEKIVNISEQLKRGILNGTDPNHKEYWGIVKEKDQRIVEAADIALGLWISREYIWNTLELHQKERIVNWLRSCVTKQTYDNNWCLFPITIVKCLEALGFPDPKHLNHINELYTKYKEKHYLGEGWFDDPPKGIDYYNAWSIHYSLFWLNQIDPYFDPDFIRESHAKFVEFYKYFFGPDGYPIMGRSICYRLAAPSPIIAGSLVNPDQISTGLAKRTLELTWGHFINKNALKDGKVTQGYYQDDLRLLDGYSGAGSCLWSLRSLIVAYYIDNEINLFDSQTELLPIEKSNFNISNNVIGWTLSGNKSDYNIKLEILKNKMNKPIKLKNYSTYSRIKEMIYQRPNRPNNKKALYDNYIYTSDAKLLLDF